jgi:hypothetical protein
MDDFSVHLMQSVCNIIHNSGAEVEFSPGGYTGCLHILDKCANKPFIPGGYTGCLQILYKGVNKPCKGYL